MHSFSSSDEDDRHSDASPTPTRRPLSQLSGNTPSQRNAHSKTFSEQRPRERAEIPERFSNPAKNDLDSLPAELLRFPLSSPWGEGRMDCPAETLRAMDAHVKCFYPVSSASLRSREGVDGITYAFVTETELCELNRSLEEILFLLAHVKKLASTGSRAYVCPTACVECTTNPKNKDMVSVKYVGEVQEGGSEGVSLLVAREPDDDSLDINRILQDTGSQGMMRVETLDLFDVFVGFTGVEFQVRAWGREREKGR